MPNLFIITGSNGAGKSTVGATYFPDDIGEIFDGDKLFLQRKTALWKSGLKVQKELNKQASAFVEKTFNERIDSAIRHNFDFAYEGHFSRDESWAVPNKFKSLGYRLHLVFFGLSSPNISSNRVLIRAKEGGHSVDPLTLRENFYGNSTSSRGIKNPFTQFILRTQTCIWLFSKIPAPLYTGPPSINTPRTVSNTF